MSERTEPVVRMPVRVRFHECDPQGIVFNAHYLAYFDMACFEFWKAICGAYANVLETGVDTVVAESNLRYLAPARFDDDLVVGVVLDQLGRTSLILGFEVYRGDTLVAAGTNRYVFVDADTFAKTPPPEALRAQLAPFVAA